ncbi:hypothetical protein ACFL59_07010 [Planctomycetota bacterium]
MKKIILIIVLLVLAGLGFTMYQHSKNIDRAPTKWSGKDWKNWITFTKTQSVKAGTQIKTTAVETSSAAWKYTTKKTKTLYDKSAGLLARLGHKEEGGEAPADGAEGAAATAANTASDAATAAAGAAVGSLVDAAREAGGETAAGAVGNTAQAVAPSADPLDSKSKNYKYGKEWLRKGVAEWRVSLKHPGAADRAKSHFERAISCFGDAKKELGGEAAVSDFLERAKEYLADTEERLELIQAEAGG